MIRIDLLQVPFHIDCGSYILFRSQFQAGPYRTVWHLEKPALKKICDLVRDPRSIVWR